MSALSSLIRDPFNRSASEPVEAPRSSPARLSLVTTPLVRMAGFPFVLLVAGILALGMLGLLLLNTTLQTRAFEVRALQADATVLAFNESELESEVARAGSPEVLARRASALGMRPNPYPAFIEVPSGKILGKPKKVNGTEMSSMMIKDAETTTVTDPQVQAQSAARLAAERMAKGIEKEQVAAQKAADKKAAAEKKAAKAEKKQVAAKAEKKAEKKAAEKKKADKKKATGN